MCMIGLTVFGPFVSRGIADDAGILSFLEPLEQVDEDGETFAGKCITSWQGELGQSPAAYVRKYRVPVG